MSLESKKCSNSRTALIERNDIVAWRAMYLRAINKYRNQNMPIVFLDETWIHPNYKVKKCWQSEDVRGVLTNDSPGQRLIISHAGGSMGFIPNALNIFQAKTTSGDYHNEMNSTNFEKWVEYKLIPNLPPECIVVMDNAPYHSVQTNKAPNSKHKKHEIQD